MDYDTMKELGWEPISLKILKQDVDIYISSDKDLQAINNKIAIQEEKTAALESMIKMISTRNYTIKNYIDFERFQVGA
jgi:septal ring factor EnvC (AmiA/AmiB activator)